jgi:GT2 family glycosyltransferase
LKHPPFISVVLVSWNSEKYLVRCLDSLANQTFQDFEIIIVDNGSTDDTLNRLKTYKQGLHFTIKKLDANYGFAVANNIGIRLAQGKWVALLNVDAFPEPDWLEQLLRAAKEYPSYNFFSSRQIQAGAPHLLDGVGDSYHTSGLAWRNHYNQPVNQYGLYRQEVFSACAAASLYLREDLINVGGFDEDYFSYFEDVDLGFRLRLWGGRCLYVPQAVVYHVGSASTGKLSDFVIYYGHRNLVWTYFKTMPLLFLCLFFPLHLLMNLYFLVSFTFKGKGLTILKSKIHALYGFRAVLKKRKEIQKNRKVKLSELLRVMSTGLFEPLQEFIQRNKGI